MQPTKKKELLVQCDFDGTVTVGEVSSLLLDRFAQGDWRQLLRQYKKGNIGVQKLNAEAFALVRADKQALADAAKSEAIVRAGFREFAQYCRQHGLKLVIVSNGLDFYINAILDDLSVSDINVFAAQSDFYPEGLRIRYIGPNGEQLLHGFKEAYLRLFLEEGYRIIYIGNGGSDVRPASQCHYVFATGDLLVHCRKADLGCVPFESFYDVVYGLEHI